MTTNTATVPVPDDDECEGSRCPKCAGPVRKCNASGVADCRDFHCYACGWCGDTAQATDHMPSMRARAKWIDNVLAAAERHGELSDPDMEVGDLQLLVRALWHHMPDEAQHAMTSNEEWREYLRHWATI